MDSFQHASFRFRQISLYAMKEQGSFREQSFRRTGFFNDNRVSHTLEMQFFLTCKFFAGVDDDRQIVRPRSVCNFSIKSKPDMSGSLRSRTMQSNLSLFNTLQRFLAGGYGCGFHIAVTDQLDNAHPLDIVVLHYQQSLDRALGKLANAIESFPSCSGVTGFCTWLKAPCCKARCRCSSTEMMWTGMWRVWGSCFRRSRTVQPSRSGKRMSSVMAEGLYFLAIARAIAAVLATRPLNPLSRARSSRMDAKLMSSSTISTVRSPASISFRSS